MKLCTFDGCERKRSAKGYCKVHYNMLNRGEPLHVIGTAGRHTRKVINKKCEFDGCINKHRAKGWCSTHYNHTVKYGAPFQSRKRLKQPVTCKFPDCQNLSKVHGYCLKHYGKWRYYGTSELIPRTVKQKECIHDGCETKKNNGGYCKKHHREFILKIPCKPRGGHNKGNKKQKETCNINNCDNVSSAKGLCSKHYTRLRVHGDPLTCYRRPRKSAYLSLDNIMKQKGTYSKQDDAEVLRENFSDIYDRFECEINYDEQL